MNSILDYFERVQALISGLSRVEIERYEDASIIFRYDNTPHHPEIVTHPDHKHTEKSVISAARPDIESVVMEVKKHIGFQE